MTAKKSSAPKKTKAPENTAASASAPKSQGGRFTAVRRPLRHPYTGTLYQPGRVTEALELDNWLKGQIEAGLIKEV